MTSSFRRLAPLRTVSVVRLAAGDAAGGELVSRRRAAPIPGSGRPRGSRSDGPQRSGTASRPPTRPVPARPPAPDRTPVAGQCMRRGATERRAAGRHGVSAPLGCALKSAGGRTPVSLHSADVSAPLEMRSRRMPRRAYACVSV